MVLVLLVHPILRHEELEVLLQLLREAGGDLLAGLVLHIWLKVRASILRARGSCGLNHHWGLPQELVLLVGAVLHLHALRQPWGGVCQTRGIVLLPKSSL